MGQTNIQTQHTISYEQMYELLSVAAEAIKSNKTEISSVNTLVAALQQSGIAQGDNLSAIINEESVMEALTEDNTVENVLYLGLEPLEEDSATYEEEDGTLTMSNASFNEENGTLTTGATFDTTTGQLKFNS